MILNTDLMWVQIAAYGDAWAGYKTENMCAVGAVEQILRVNYLKSNMYRIELWERFGRGKCHSEYSKMFYSINSVREAINNIIKDLTHTN